MDKYKRYYGIIAFVVAISAIVFLGYKLITPQITNLTNAIADISKKEQELQSKQQKLQIVQNKIKRIKDSITGSQKKIYYPIESDLGNDTLFFTLYNDLIEMIHQNSVRVKSIDYNHNPETDAFVKFGKEVYFVCDVNLEIVSNYVNLGKLIQDIYQYPYYIKINELEVKPYNKDKKVLISNLSLRLYAHTSPEETQN